MSFLIPIGDYILNWDSLLVFICLIILLGLSIPLMIHKECKRTWFLTLLYGNVFVFMAASRLFNLQNRDYRLSLIVEKFCEKELAKKKELCSFSVRYDNNLEKTMIFLELKKDEYSDFNFYKRNCSETESDGSIAIAPASSKWFLDLELEEVIQFKKRLISNKTKIKHRANEFFKE